MSGGMVSVRLEKTNNTTGASAHAHRDKVPDYVDSSRTHLNAVVWGGRAPSEKQLRSAMNAYHKEVTGRALRRDTRVAWDGIITFSADANANALDRSKMDECAFNFVKALCEQRFGVENDNLKQLERTLLYLVRHDDETTVHYHFLVTNQRFDNAKPVNFKRADFVAVQDLAGHMFSPMGLKRGKKKVERIADNEPRHKIIHRSVRELHEDLPREIESAKAKLSKYKRLIDANSQKLLALQAQISDQQLAIQKQQQEIERLEKRIEIYKRRENDALERLRSLSAAISTLEHVLDDAQAKAIAEALASVERAFDDPMLDDPLGNGPQGGFKPSS